MPSRTTTLYLRGVPTELAREAKAVAARRGSTLTAFAIASLERSLHQGGEDRELADDDLAQGRRWCELHRDELLARYDGEYVAVHEGSVVDHDRDFDALASRVFERLGSRPVLMPRIQRDEARARLRSPRTARR